MKFRFGWVRLPACALSLVLPLALSHAANMTPVNVTGFNRDVVIEKTYTPVSYPVPASVAMNVNSPESNCYYQSNWPGRSTAGLPDSGQFISALDGATVFQLQPYTGPNDLVLGADTGSTVGTLTLAAPNTYSRIAVLASSGSGGGSATLTFNFADGSGWTSTYNAPDWFNGSGYALAGFERINPQNGSASGGGGATGNPRLYQTTFDLASTLGPTNKTLVSITFNKAASANSTGIYAVSGEVLPNTPAAIASNPTNQTVNELFPASFTSIASGNPYPSLQWYRNGSPIAGATSSTYSIPSAALSDNGASFWMVASNFVGSSMVATSAPATLTVIADTNPPVLLSAYSLGLNQVLASFSERLKPQTATNAANFSITGTNGPLPISSATLDASQTNVILTVAPMTDRAPYTLTVNNVADQSAAGNVIAPNSRASFFASVYVFAALGNPVPAGNQVPTGNGFNLTAGGSSVGGTNDQAQLSYVTATGDFDVRVRVDSMMLADAWSQAGLMAREDLTAGGRNAAALATPSISGCYFQARGATNGATTVAGSFPVNYPNTWLRLSRAGNLLSGYAGIDGQNWFQLGSSTVTLPGTIYLGFVISSHNTNQSTTAAFRDYSSVTNPGVAALPPFEPLGQASRLTSLVISEIMYHPTNGGSEFIELFNSRGERQDISGYKLAGDISYTFAPGTVIPGGGFLVIAESPSSLQTNYNISGVLGPYTNKLSNSGGSVKLINQAGAVLLDVNYSDQPPWPVAADGAGHSLVLARPSYGQNNPSAWAQSDSVGGSPGRADPYTPDPLRNVVINEFLAHTDFPVVDYIELYNHSTQSVDVSGCILSDDPDTNKCIIPSGTIIPARGFLVYTETNMNFSLNADGETIYFKNPSNTRVLDVVLFESQENGIATGRYPDGGDQFYRLSTQTPGATNAPILISPVIINELMYSPISGNDDDQYVELFNRSAGAVDLSGWRLSDAISFTFPTNTLLASSNYVVVAKSSAHLITNYPTLNTLNTLGDFSGKLKGGGERLTLRKPDTAISTNGVGVITTNFLHIVMDEVSYAGGGRWPGLASGGGSSLERIDPHSNGRLSSNWAASDETHKAPWKTISATGTMDNGDVAADQLQVLQAGPGECLVDNVQVSTPTNPNLIANSTFETDASGWTAEGTESTSGLETSEGSSSSRSYHIRALERGDNEINRVRTPLMTSIASGATNVTIRADVRWLKGDPNIILRLRGNWLQCSAVMALPVSPGTPGAANSRFVTNAGPAITGVTHSPVLPAASQPIVVSARVHDPDGIAGVTLNYRLDPSATYSSVTMNDFGTNGDAVAGDGVFSGAIPGQSGGTMIAFYLQAADRAVPPASTSFPNDAPTRECLVRVGELQPTGNFPVYRIWMSQSTSNLWFTRKKLDNTPLDVTFVLGNQRAIYNTLALYAGSPYISPGYSGPASSRCGYSITVPEDDPFLGETDLVLDWPGGHGNETSAMQEEMGYWIADKLNLPYSHRYIIRLHVNGVTDDARAAVFEAVQQPASSFIKAWSPNDTSGRFYKIERAYEFNDGGSLVADPEPRLQNYTTTGGAKKLEKYRWNFLPRAGTDPNDYTNIFALADAVNAASPEPYTSASFGLADMREIMRIFATEHIIENFDSWGHEIGKNMYGYQPVNGKWQIYMFDLDWLMLAANNHGYSPSSAPLFNAEDPTVTRMYNFPPFLRLYWQAVLDAVNGPMQGTNCNPVMDAKYASLVGNGVRFCDGQALTDPGSVKVWFVQRLAFLQSQLATVSPPFAVNPSIQISNGVGIISGTAPVGVDALWINGAPWTVTWTTVTNWTATVPLFVGSNAFSVVGVNLSGQVISGASNLVSVVYSGTVQSPVGNMVFSEIMATPSLPGAEYVEFFNNSSNYTFDLSSWNVNGLSYTFPNGAAIGPRSYLLLAKDRQAFDIAYGSAIAVYDQYDGNLQSDGETLTLIKLGTNVIAKVRYSTSAPWTTNGPVFGSSLQLLDSTQDNWRAGNWKAAPTNGGVAVATPGGSNSVAVALPAFPPLWINELEAENLTGITNRAGKNVPWLELYNPSSNTVSLSGLYLANNYSNLLQWPFPLTASLTPGQFKIIFADGQTNLTTATEWHAGFTLSPGTGSLALSRVFNGQPQVLDYVDYSNLRADRSFGSFPDAQAFDRQEFFYTTPAGTNNAISAPLTVFINEWMADNTITLADPADGHFEDWFEIYNPTATDVDLGGYFLTDTLTNKFQYQIPNNGHYKVPAHGFLLVWADNETSQNATNRADLHVNFKLDKAGEAIGLFAADGTTIDAITFGAQASDVSQGRYPDGSNGIYFMTSPTPHTNNFIPNTPPTLAPIPNQTVTVGQSLSFTASATDTDQPPQTLTFSLLPGAPNGAFINPSTGLFTWTPSLAPSTNSLTVKVADNGSPVLSATQSFTVTVLTRPQVSSVRVTGSQFIFSWVAPIGQNVQLEYRDDLNGGPWTPLGSPYTGNGATISVTNTVTASQQRFFRLRVLP